MTQYTGTAGNILVPVTFTTGATALSYWYIITDANDNILNFVNPANEPDPNNVVLDLSSAPPGECHIWGWSYRGEGDPIPGDNISTLTDGACEAISTNFITVTRQAPAPVCNVDGGTISTSDRTSLCVDGIPDPINVSVSGGQGSQRGWIITDDQRNILDLPAGPPFDLDGAGVGNCYIYYIRYEAGLTGLAIGQNVNNLAGCYDLSNRIDVIRQIPDGGLVTTQSGATQYTGTAGNILVPVTFTTGATALSYWYIITDANDNILNFVNPANEPDPNNIVLDLSSAPPGECHIWGWSYRGEGDPIPGDNISTLTDGACEAISTNFITVTRQAADAGAVCPTPSTPTVTRIAQTKLYIEWPAVTGAKGYIIQARLRGTSGWAVTAALRYPNAKVWAIADRDFEYRLKTVCTDGTESEYSPVYEFNTRSIFDAPPVAQSRNAFDADVTLLDQLVNQNDLQIAPNPFNNFIQLTYQSASENARVQVYHVSGQKVQEQALPINRTNHTINLNNVDAGMYLLTIQEDGQKVVSRKIIKQSNK